MLGSTPGCRWFGSVPGEGVWTGGAKEVAGCAVAEYMAPFSPSDSGLGAGATFCCTGLVGEVGRLCVSTFLAAVGVTGLAGSVVVWVEGSLSLVLFFLRKPRLGIEALRLGAQVVLDKPREWAEKGGCGHRGTAGGGGFQQNRKRPAYPLVLGVLSVVHAHSTEPNRDGPGLALPERRAVAQGAGAGGREA